MTTTVVVRFYRARGTCEQSPTRHSSGDGAWIKEGKHAVEWMRLSCHKFKGNAVRLALFVLAYNLSLRERLIKIGARLVRHARRLVLQMAEVSITRALFGELLERIWGLAPVGLH